ncbi:phospholipase D-like domain-containing protein [Natrinema halophilum]|uniref:Phospholipase n=1 Tax=Natrinema halophilum TaxID=1699371 RepID=A0A7D5KWE1_9EURY|nr:phospholipase D-like domain-containing protein [Natrinema halophilum]QLG47362.1 phospholipase D-like domain-containing protein [Natrinema halophilum]
MNVRRAILIAALVCTLVGSTALLVEFTITDDSSTAGPEPTRAVTPSNPNSTTLDCPARASTAVTNESQPPPQKTSADPRIVGLYPNPITDENVGEFVVLDVPSQTGVRNWTLSDGHTSVGIPNETGAGRFALSTAPNVTETMTDVPVFGLEGHLRLAADGDTLRLRNGTTTVDSVSYGRAPEAERWYRSFTPTDQTVGGTDGQWWPRDATCLPISSAAVDEANLFVLPDAPNVPRETIRSADHRLLLAGYTITSETIAADLVAAANRGVDVAVLLEASPVGGTPAPTEAVLETLERGGVDVRAIGGEGARYRYHHPKYAVADDSVLVTTENWKPAGVGGKSSRGWGVRLEDETLASDLARVFRADFEGWDTTGSTAYRANTSFVDDEAPTVASSEPRLPRNHEPTTVSIDSAELLVAPDNADRRLQELIAAADDELLVVQPRIAADVSLLESTIEAARRGVDVRILLGSTWYNAEKNEALVADLERLAANDDLPLEIRLAENTGRFEKIHAKGVVIDRDVAIVGSANWNSNSLENNREVLVALHGESAADYYASVFEADWSGERWQLPIGILVPAIIVSALAAVVGRRYVRFGELR